MSPDGNAIPSNVRVFVRWHEQTVFAGEEVRCTVTFKNVAPGPNQQRQQQQPQQQSRQASRGARGKPTLLNPQTARGHRAGLSLGVPALSPRKRIGSGPWSPVGVGGGVPEGRQGGQSHRRSVSIVSIGSASTEERSETTASSSRSKRYNRGHARASSLQITSRPGASGPSSGNQSPRNVSSPIFNAPYPQGRHGRPTGISTVPSTPSVLNPHDSPRSVAPGLSEFRFPNIQSPLSEVHNSSETRADELLSPSGIPESGGLGIRPKDAVVPTITESAAPSARILAANSMGSGTPRSSGEFYSMSNNSSETLASEYVTQQPSRGNGRPSHFRRPSNLSQQQAKLPEALMMGYAQLQGSFTLDGSLVNLGPFEHVKKKAVVGGQGGGVIGVETTKRDSGLLGGFGWGTISNSLGELLGGGELSSIKEMRSVASSKAVPLLSTPQSILFVDLQLAPGESKSFEYSFILPRGLPPTHKGKAIKISYSLVIGTQRPGGTKEQQVRSVEIPFKVLGSVNSVGEILGYDLMNPYIILQDQAKVKAVTISKSPNEERKKPEPTPKSSLNEFLGYVDELLTRPQDNTSALLSPAAAPNSRRPSGFEEAATAKEAIDFAIMRSNLATEGQQSPNRFEIARNGQRVGVVVLTRPAYRLGEVVTLIIDFSNAEIPCYAVHADLETSEKVDPGLALRSEASIHRVTRRVYVSSSEATLYARRMVFSPTIPVAATPEFMTSGVSLDWTIRLEFVVPAQDAHDFREGGLGMASVTGKPHPLLEQISRDEKGGLVLVAVEHLACESFEVAVPLKVYGAVGTGLERLEKDDALEGGLPV